MSTILRQATNVARQASRARTFASSAVTRKDLVQDLYLREIKAYKPAATAQDAHVGVVKKYALPPKPKAPLLPSDLAGELSAYDAAEPTLADAPAPVATSSSEEVGTGAEAFLTFLEQDLPKPEHHH
ncbi:ATP synthase complex subunit H-domain-containing protein [Crassisporium funariophilum]|nr:ATP synthase complex subunit H-domain-containing protein [Crassisporium funariophilum]